MESTEKNTSFLDNLPDTVETIDPNAIVDIKMSFSFFNRVRNIYTSMIESKTPEEIESFQNQLTSKNITDQWVVDLETIMILINEFQKNVKEEGKMITYSKDEIIEMMNKEKSNLNT